MWRPMPRPATAALLATALTWFHGSTAARADAITTYKYITNTMIGNGSGAHSIALDSDYGVDTATVPGTFQLGTFTTNPLLPGETVTYKDTPFSVDLKVAPNDPSITSAGSFATSPLVTDYQISGLLNGTIASDGTSTLFPTIRSVAGGGIAAPFQPADLNFALPMIAAPVGDVAGTTTLTASIAVDANGKPLPAPAPEPATVLTFAAALAGWARARRRPTARPGEPRPRPID